VKVTLEMKKGIWEDRNTCVNGKNISENQTNKLGFSISTYRHRTSKTTPATECHNPKTIDRWDHSPGKHDKKIRSKYNGKLTLCEAYLCSGNHR
jgi:hypothetical protein